MLDPTNPEDLKKIIETLNENQLKIQSNMNELFFTLFSKISDIEYQLELFARMQEKLFIKDWEQEETPICARKVTLEEYKDMAKACKKDLDDSVKEINQMKD